MHMHSPKFELVIRESVPQGQVANQKVYPAKPQCRKFAFHPPLDFEVLLPHAVAPWIEPPSWLEIRVTKSNDEPAAAHTRLLESLNFNDVAAYPVGCLTEGIAVRVEREGEVLWALRSRGLGWHMIKHASGCHHLHFWSGELLRP